MNIHLNCTKTRWLQYNFLMIYNIRYSASLFYYLFSLWTQYKIKMFLIKHISSQNHIHYLWYHTYHCRYYYSLGHHKMQYSKFYSTPGIVVKYYRRFISATITGSKTDSRVVTFNLSTGRKMTTPICYLDSSLKCCSVDLLVHVVSHHSRYIILFILSLTRCKISC